MAGKRENFGDERRTTGAEGGGSLACLMWKSKGVGKHVVFCGPLLCLHADKSDGVMLNDFQENGGVVLYGAEFCCAFSQICISTAVVLETMRRGEMGAIF